MIDLSVLIAIVSLSIAAISFITNFNRNSKKDTTEVVEERATMNARLLTKLDTISDDVRDIKKDSQDMRKDIAHLSERVLVLEHKGSNDRRSGIDRRQNNHEV